MPGRLTAALGDQSEKRPAGTSRILDSHLLLASENSQTHHSVYSEGKTPLGVRPFPSSSSFSLRAILFLKIEFLILILSPILSLTCSRQVLLSCVICDRGLCGKTRYLMVITIQKIHSDDR